MEHHSHDSSSHSHVHSSDSHDDSSHSHSSHGHGHGHHKAKHYSDEERQLWGLPKSSWNKCTDEFLDYRTCTTKASEGFYPFRFFYAAQFADRYVCQGQFHLYQECYLTLLQDFYDENRQEIAARQ